jgi:hypothetical protein
MIMFERRNCRMPTWRLLIFKRLLLVPSLGTLELCPFWQASQRRIFGVEKHVIKSQIYNVTFQLFGISDGFQRAFLALT